MEYSEELSRKIVASSWQCTNCKTCSICQRPDPSEDEQMLFCDACDLGYHMPCHRPPVAARPVGKWICYRYAGYKDIYCIDYKHFLLLYLKLSKVLEG